MAFTESEVIALLAQVFASSNPNLEVGIGDDAAVIRTSNRTVITTDMAVEGVHFRLEWSSAFEIGRKITAANLADVFSMGAKPTFLVIAVSLTGNEDLEWIKNLAKGIAFEANLVGAAVVGGDLAKGAAVTIAITALGEFGDFGEVMDPILRSGAQVGDQIYLSNLTGWSRAGLAILEKGLPIESDSAKRAVAAFRAPILNYAYAANLAKATAMSDVSDSIVSQAEQMAAASNVKFNLDFNLFQAAADFSELRTLSAELNVSVSDLILGGGEDHVFLATGKDLPGLLIGNVSVGSGLNVSGNEKAPDTWRHFD
jgi:thiamine-monophosphate kinase